MNEKEKLCYLPLDVEVMSVLTEMGYAVTGLPLDNFNEGGKPW